MFNLIMMSIIKNYFSQSWCKEMRKVNENEKYIIKIWKYLITVQFEDIFLSILQ